MTMRAKRSGTVTLTAIGAVSMLAGCDAPVDEAKLSAERFGAPTQVAAFQSVAECVAGGSFTEAQCQTAQNQAWGEDKTAAPQYLSRADCEENFGKEQCVERSNSGGGSIFTPLLTGFMIGQLMNGGGYRYAPLYRDRKDDRYYTGSGAWLTPGSSRNNYSVGRQALAAPAVATTQRIQTRSSVVSRGGFGGRATSGSRGGWGGS